MKEIKAKEGMYLTQVAEVGEDRIFVKALKGIKINEADWRDATQEEKDAWDKAHEQNMEDNFNR